MEGKNQIQVQTAEPQNQLVFGSKQNFEDAQRMAKALCASSIIPELYRGEKGMANCIIALEMANRIGASPMMIMQNLYIVHGNPGWSSKFLISCLNTCGKFSPLRYEFKGEQGKDSWGCRAYATDRTGERLNGSWVTIDMAKREGWYGKTGSKWQSMPELMLQYRAAAFFQRAYAPEISMGMQTAEEVIDVAYEDVTPTQAPTQGASASLADQIRQQAEQKKPKGGKPTTGAASEPKVDTETGEVIE